MGDELAFVNTCCNYNSLPVFLGLLGKRVRDAWSGEKSIVADGLLDEKLSGVT
jgi:hypothetical protein